MVMLVGLARVADTTGLVMDAEHDEHAWWPPDPADWPDEADPPLRLMAALLEPGDNPTPRRRSAPFAARRPGANLGGMEPSRNIAARAGRWSAQHRKAAVLGWLAFVVTAVVLGGLTGTKLLTDEEQGSGESARADKALAKAFPQAADESVLVQSSKLEGRRPGLPRRGGRRGATAVGGQGRRRRDVALPQRRRHLQEPRAGAGEPEDPRRRRRGGEEASTPCWPPPRRHSRRTPSCASSSSATPAPTRPHESFEDDFKKAEITVAADHAADPADRLRRARRRGRAAAPRHLRRGGDDRPDRPDQPDPRRWTSRSAR